MAAWNWLYALRPEESNARVSLGTQVAKELRATYQLTPIADPNSFPWTKQQDVCEVESSYAAGLCILHRNRYRRSGSHATMAEWARAQTPHLVINMLVSSVTGQA
jgi:hypothetical protein